MTGLRPRRIALALLLGLLVLATPDSGRQAATVSLVKVETAKAVDFGQDVVWFLVLGSDARGAEEVRKGRADAIQLVGVDFETGSAVAFGVPRDSWVEIEGHGPDRINAGLMLGGQELMADLVEDLFAIPPDYVVTVGFGGFRGLVDRVGGVQVESRLAFSDQASGLDIRKGRNQLDGDDAVQFARARRLPGDDFARSANHQELMKGIARQLAAREDEVGFIEGGVRAALGALDTNLSPSELYRLAQAVTQVDLRTARTCVLDGTPDTINGASIIQVDRDQARRLGGDAREDARLDRPCRG
ncbi:MAG TPA: LCP family protein [Intrasporangium sp.]|nr:LCP family protein [Intrasporangium sp.]